MHYGPVPFPRGFEPEEYGWHVVNPVAPHQQTEAAADELRRFGFVSTHWERWEVPYRSPAELVRCGYDRASDCFYGMYLPPFVGRVDSFTVREIHRQMRLGTGGGVISLDRPSVSPLTISVG